MPVGLRNLDTLQVTACFKTVLDAQKARAMTEGNDPNTDPALFDRAAGCSCCDGDCGCGDCGECKSTKAADSMGTVMYSTPKTISW